MRKIVPVLALLDRRLFVAAKRPPRNRRRPRPQPQFSPAAAFGAPKVRFRQDPGSPLNHVRLYGWPSRQSDLQAGFGWRHRAYRGGRVVYDPRRVSYAELVRRFLPTIDALTRGGQFCDRGDSYRPALFVANAQERQTAAAALKAVHSRISEPLAVALLPAARFWPAEGYHQDYYKGIRCAINIIAGVAGATAGSRSFGAEPRLLPLQTLRRLRWHRGSSWILRGPQRAKRGRR